MRDISRRAIERVTFIHRDEQHSCRPDFARLRDLSSPPWVAVPPGPVSRPGVRRPTGESVSSLTTSRARVSTTQAIPGLGHARLQGRRVSSPPRQRPAITDPAAAVASANALPCVSAAASRASSDDHCCLPSLHSAPIGNERTSPWQPSLFVAGSQVSPAVPRATPEPWRERCRAVGRGPARWRASRQATLSYRRSNAPRLTQARSPALWPSRSTHARSRSARGRLRNRSHRLHAASDLNYSF
jgi:hypothetical protein